VYPLSSEGCIKTAPGQAEKEQGLPSVILQKPGDPKGNIMNQERISLLICVLVLGANSVSDIRRREILPVFTCLAAGAGALWKLAVLKCGLGPLLLSLIPGVLSAVLSFLTDEDIGYGDAILIAAAGIWCGSPLIWFLIGVAMIVAAAAAAFLLLRKFFRSRKIAGPAASHRSELPLAPFLFGAGILCLLFG
jgi:prepilin signal peptidase PulO-like enzyme (type II secretory pathway)